MKKVNLLATAFAAAALSLSSAQADAHKDMEKCKIVDSHGKGLVKEHKGDCAGAANSCAGHNKSGDPTAWILVPKGECAKINMGDFSGVDESVKDKVEMTKKEDMMHKASSMKDKASKMMDKASKMKDTVKDMTK